MSGKAPGTDNPGGGQRGSNQHARGAKRRNAAGRERGAVRSGAQRSRNAPAQRARKGDVPRRIAFEVLREVASSDAYANLVLPPALRKAGLRGRDASFTTELTYGTLRMGGRYDAIIALCIDRPLNKLDAPVLDLLRLGVHQLLGMRVPPHAAVSETVALARATVGTGASQFINAILRKVSATSLPQWLEQIGPDPARVESHPEWIVRSLREALIGHGRSPDELTDLLKANNTPARVILVARPGLQTVDGLTQQAQDVTEAEDITVTPGRYAPTAGVLSGSDPALLESVRSGTAAVQDEGSQLVTLAFAGTEIAGSDSRWLDMCAGPGGKAALLAALAAQNGARLVANEVAPHRATLVERALRAIPPGTVEEVRVSDGTSIGDDEPAAYDRVLLDAPCTGLGALRRRPESRWRRTPRDLANLTELQYRLLTSAINAVRPGGIVAYITCSPHIAETQLVVRDAIKGRSDVQLLDAPASVRAVAGDIDLPDRADVQLWPHIHGTDAMHLTLLQRLG